MPPSTAELHTDWARNLRHRTGWYGLKTRQQGVLVLFTIVMDRKTHYINLKNTNGRCIVDTTLCIGTLLHELSHLEALLADDEVTATWEYTVEGVVAGPNGVSITLATRSQITAPARKPRKVADEDDGEDQSDDDLVVIGSDAESDGRCKVVYSGGESESDDDDDAGSDASSEASVGNLKENVKKMILRMAPAAAVHARPATGGGHGPGTKRPALWSDDFFWVADNTAEYIQVRIRGQYNVPADLGGMGGSRATMTKLVHPFEFGEPRDAPVRSL